MRSFVSEMKDQDGAGAKNGLRQATLALYSNEQYNSSSPVFWYRSLLSVFLGSVFFSIETNMALFSFPEKRFIFPIAFRWSSASAILPKRALVLACAGTLVTMLSHKNTSYRSFWPLVCGKALSSTNSCRIILVVEY